MKLKQSQVSKTDYTTVRWQDHIGLILSILLSALVILKIYAVSGWSPLTATGIISLSGTNQVIFGSILASLPIIYFFMFIFLIPRITKKIELSKRSGIEKTAVLTHTWPATLSVFIFPPYLVFVFFGVALTLIFIALIIRRKNQKLNQKDKVSRFESNTILLSSIAMVVFLNLHIPWMPSKIIDTLDMGKQTGYVLSSDSQTTYILLHKPRQIIEIPSNSIKSSQLCELSKHWTNYTILQLLSGDKGYPKCPDPNSVKG